MRAAVFLTVSARCGFMALLFAERSDNDRGSLLMPVLLAGLAGVRRVLAAA